MGWGENIGFQQFCIKFSTLTLKAFIGFIDISEGLCLNIIWFLSLWKKNNLFLYECPISSFTLVLSLSPCEDKLAKSLPISKFVAVFSFKKNYRYQTEILASSYCFIHISLKIKILESLLQLKRPSEVSQIGNCQNDLLFFLGFHVFHSDHIVNVSVHFCTCISAWID